MNVTLYISLLVLLLITGSISFYIIGRLGKLIYDLWKGYGVPFVPTKSITADLLLENLSINPGEVFIDCGCGDGYVLDRVTQDFSYIKAWGYEINSDLYKLVTKKISTTNKIYKVYNKNFFNENLSEATIVYCYLMPHLMKKFWKKVSKECKPGTLLYSNTFPVIGISPAYVLGNREDKRGEKIYVYRV